MLLLLPNLLGEIAHHEPFIPQSVDRAVAKLDGLIAESESAGRRYLGRFETKKPASQIPIAIYDQKTPDQDLDFLLDPLKKGKVWGYVSDAGLPCIADPGSKLVWRARQLGIRIRAFVGPSSILMGLMLSGLPAQKFQFHGYLSAELVKRKRQILDLEKQSKKERLTQIFMETPYRNMHLLEQLVNTLHPETILCVVWNLTLPTQGVVSQKVFTWEKSPLPNLRKKPAIFLVNFAMS